MSIPCAVPVAASPQPARIVPTPGSNSMLCRALAGSLFALLAALPAHAQSAEKTIGIPNTINLITSDSVRQGSPTDWNALAPLRNTSTLDLLHQSPTPLIDLGLIGIKLSQEVPVIDIIQELVYAKPTVTVEESVWFPVTKGLY